MASKQYRQRRQNSIPKLQASNSQGLKKIQTIASVPKGHLCLLILPGLYPGFTIYMTVKRRLQKMFLYQSPKATE